MTPAARVEAAIELLDQIVVAARDGGAAADTLVSRYFQTRRYAGSKDRRAVRDLVYRAIRRAGERPVNGRAAMLGLAADDSGLSACFDGSSYGPAPILQGEPVASAGVAPAWLLARLAGTLDEPGRAALLDRAPLDLRVNRLKAERAAVTPLIPGAALTPHAPDGLRVAEGTRIEGLDAWRDGLVEIQDEGSQIAAIATGARPGMTVVDLCAGAGGKTLALAALMAGEGRLIACDTDRGRLGRLPPRADRAGARGIEIRLLDPGREAAQLTDLEGATDIVLIDAPCSGTGTWRRNPEARWRLTPERLDRLVATQARLLENGARLVRGGGHLTYVVCSLLYEEGVAQMDAFLARHPGWTLALDDLPAGRRDGSGWRLTPAEDGTDGFFIARFQRPC